MIEEAEGGRIFFSSTGRTLAEEDEICLLTVGVDIGSSTSHLVFSRIVLERLDARYVVSERETFYQSDILLTPYAAEEDIDADALGAFIARQYADAKVDPDEIDTGALILTGVAVRRRNARKIGELFARQAGKLVAVSAGDSLESVLAAYGSGTVARSIRDQATVMNVDVGGGTAKIAVCADGKVIDVTAADIGARLVVVDVAGRIERVEEAGRRFGAELGRSRHAWRIACSRRWTAARRKRPAPVCCVFLRCPGAARSTGCHSRAAWRNTSTAAMRNRTAISGSSLPPKSAHGSSVAGCSWRVPMRASAPP